MVTAITGGSFGDEGKGKMTDLLAAKADIVVRFQGGANAGHTIINDHGKFVLHMLPSGVFYGHTVNVIASSAAFDADEFFNELEMLKERGVPEPSVRISSRAQLLLPIHKTQDRLEEERLGKNSFGSTRSGIAPFYSDKYAKHNFQISELFSDGLTDKITRFCEDKNKFFREFYGIENALPADVLTKYLAEMRSRLEPYLIDCPYYMNDAVRAGKNILLEGQLGALRDVDNGIYPFVTSSSPLAGFGSVSAGIPPYEIKSVIAVIKAYSTCVGAGAFVGELFGDEAEELRKRGGDSGEYGAKTGRPRRIAWFDCVAARYGCMVQGAAEAALTMLDVLGFLDRIPVCVGYMINGKTTDKFPETHQLSVAEPIYEYIDGWKCDISGIGSWDDLPAEAKRYVEFIEDRIGVPITMISNGPRREQIIFRKVANKHSL
ncbi:MAG: adenylosuccinate synthase [Oscillospiraceae bacterium]|nr:adenylosuccinate synthase [Oscillospiraceae bacterium]